MVEIEVGSEKFEMSYSNRDILDLENSFDGKSISNVFLLGDKITNNQMSKIIYFGIRKSSGLTYDAFVDKFLLSQYAVGGLKAVEAIGLAFGNNVKKK